MSLSPLNGSTPVRQLTPVAKAEVAPQAPVITAKATEGDEPKTPTGIAKWAADKLVKVGGDIGKLPFWEKALISVVGFFVGWKFNDWVHKQVEKNEGERFDKYGQDQYRSLKSQGDAALLAELKEPHTFTQNVKDWDILEKKWGAFNTYTVLAETANPTLGSFNGKDNAPVALIALASNKTADKNAITMLAQDIKRRGNGAPAKQAFYADVVKALKDVHGVTVAFDQQ
jgi:hypothetical protein